MKINFSEPIGMDTILTIDNNEYRIEGFQDNLGTWIPNIMIRAIYSKENFRFSNTDDDLKVEANNLETIVTHNGKTKTFPVTKMDLAKAIAHDFRANLLDWSVLNSSRLRRKMTDEEFTEFALKDKRAQRIKPNILEALNELDNLIESEI